MEYFLEFVTADGGITFMGGSGEIAQAGSFSKSAKRPSYRHSCLAIMEPTIPAPIMMTS